MDLMEGRGKVGDLGRSLGFTHVVKGTGVPTDEAAAHPEQSVSVFVSLARQQECWSISAVHQPAH